MSRNPNPMIPPNFVTLKMLKELKEKREEEERLKREEEERLKREEEERVRKLKEKEEQERIRRLKEEEEEESLKNRRRTIRSGKPYGGNFRRDAHPKARLSGDVRSIPDSGANGQAKAGHDGRSKPPRCPDLDAQMPRNGRSDLDVRAAAAADGGSDSNKMILDESKKKKKTKAKGRGKKEASKGREGEETKMPLGLNGFTAPMIEKEPEMTKVTADVDGSGIIKVSDGERCRPLKVTGSEACSIAEVKKGISDLNVGGGNPNPHWRGRGRGGSSWGGGRRPGSFGRGRREGGMMWVKKTTES